MNIDKADTYREEIIELLAAENLPINDLPATLENFLVAMKDEKVIGVIGLEIYGPFGLLRSLAVKPEHRGEGVAAGLLTDLETLAHSKSLSELYLLTETAPEYFSRKRFEKISRLDVPAEVQQSTEFSHVCPQSAIVMRKSILNQKAYRANE